MSTSLEITFKSREYTYDVMRYEVMLTTVFMWVEDISHHSTNINDLKDQKYKSDS